MQTITPTSVLPTITSPVTIDGYTQPGASANTLAVGNDATLLIELDGNGALFDGLAATAGGTTITGLVINDFAGDAIDLRTNGNNLISGNFLGTNAAGTGLPANGGGIFIQNSPNNRIGGNAPAARNVINATQNYAIYTPGACVGCPVDTGGGNIIQGNYLGTDKHGTGTITPPPNVRGGIRLENANNVIGGTTAGARNVMSTVGVGGITLQEAGAHHNTIQGNYIGVGATGAAQLAPGWGAVAITVMRASDNLIGGTDPGARNVISSPSGGINIFGVSGPTTPANNVIQGNYIGTDATGSVGMPVSAGSAILIDSSSGNTIGGTAAGAGNVLSRSARGVHIQTQAPVAANNVVQGNLIGTNASGTGTAALGNSSGGVVVSSTGGAPSSSTNNTIGGTSAGARNVISANTGNGIWLTGAANTTIQGNYIGVAADGAAALGNSGHGIEISSGTGNVIGGEVAGARNVISGNGADGVRIWTSGNTIKGNYIGLDANGTVDVGNASDGVELVTGSSTVGGTATLARNVISGNNGAGVNVTSSGNSIQGNYIGTNASGTLGVGNTTHGISISGGADDNVVGGTATGAGNVISGNAGAIAVLITGLGTDSNDVQGNLIGTTSSGNDALANSSGILIGNSASSNTIGGSTASATNVISGNNGQGIRLVGGATNTTIQRNLVGVGQNGTQALGNGGSGIFILDASNNLVGGRASGAGNQIAHNGAAAPGANASGVMVTGASAGNSVLGNSISANGDEAGDLGIDLGGDGVTANDGSPVGCTAPPSNLAGWWPGDHSAANFGGGPAATLVNGAGYLDGKVGGTFSFDGVNDLVATGFSTTPESATIESWFRTPTPDHEMAIAGYKGALQLRVLGNGAVRAAWRTSLSRLHAIDSGPGAVPPSTWVHAAVVYESSTTSTRLYVNGALVAGPATSGIDLGAAAGTPPPITIGGFGPSGAVELPFGGQVDEATIYSRALGAPEIAAIFSADGAGKCKGVDGDAGSNQLQNFPTVESATADGAELALTGTLNSAPNTNYTLDFYESAAGDQSGFGEGTRYVGSQAVATNASGHALWSASLEASPTVGHVVSATATDPAGNTSEFSRVQTVAAGDAAQGGPTFTVNTAVDTEPDACTEGNCTLREAINAANAAAGANEIHFDIGGGGLQTIQPTSPLPALTGPTVVDGTTQGSFEDDPLIVVNGASAGVTADGLIVSGGSSEIRGLVVNGFTRGSGIVLNSAGSNVIAGNWIGTNATGSGSAANGTGITIAGDSDNNTVGGTVAADRNVVSGNRLVETETGFAGGVGLTILAGSTGNLVQGNYVGLAADGTGAIGNLGIAGIRILGSSNTIGGTADGAANLVSANDTGISVGGDDNLVQGNRLTANDGEGVFVSGSNNTIGGTTAAARNLISENVGSGVWIFGSGGTGGTGNEVLGNYIGTDAGGTLDRGNDSGSEGTAAGVFINNGAANNIIGGATAGAGNVISGNETGGVQIEGAATGNSVRGNLIGTNAAGTAALPNDEGGVVIEGAQNNTIGGPSESSDFNLTSGNTTSAGVIIKGEDASGNVVRGNRIGTTLNGQAALPNETGVHITGGAHDNAIGAAGGGAQQVISGNALNAVHIQGAGTNNAVRGNRIGVALDGTTVVANDIGVVLDSGSNQVGGTIPAHRNVISGNTDAGVLLNSGGNTVAGNFIGTDASGAAPAGNGIDGIRILSGANTIGGTTTASANVISGNASHGIEIASDGNTVQRNFIGTDLAGTAEVGNGDSGIAILSSGNVIGGDDPATANKIAFNGTDGVTVTGSAANNRITANSIVSNGDGDDDIGVDLAGNGVSANDPNDADSGPNNHQNFPGLTSVTAEEGGPRIVGTLQSAANTAYRVDYYETPCASEGDREGERWLGWSLISTNADGVATIDTGDGLTSEIAAGEFVTATATDPSGNTSEFSACQEVQDATTPAEATIGLASDQTSVVAGAQRVPTEGIDIADLQAIPTATRSAPLDAVPLDAVPLDAVPLDAVPLDAVPLDAVGLTSDLLREAFGGVHLSDVPLSTPGGWETKLKDTPLAGVPLNTITLADVYELNEKTTPDAIPLDAVPLDAVDLSGTPLDAVGLGAIALGATPLDAVPLDAVGTNSAAENADDWCKLINTIEGYGCPPIDATTETVIGAAIRGIPLDAVPLDAVPLDAVPLDAVPLDAVPLDAVPLDAVSLANSPLDAVPLDAVDFAVSPLDAVPLDAVGPGIVDCSSGFDCTGKTLGDADAADRIIDGVSLGDLVEALLAGHGASVADLIYGLPGTVVVNGETITLTLGHLFALLLGGEGAYDWSTLDLTRFPVALHSPDGGVITYRATLQVTGGAAQTEATVHAALPAGGYYKDGSAALIRKDTAASVELDEPSVGETALEWKADLEEGIDYELKWQVHAPIELGSYAVSANVIVPGMSEPDLSSPVSVEVTQALEPNNTVGAGPELQPDTLYLSHMLRGDVDRFVVPIPAAFGSRVEITLSHIDEGTDLDLAVAGPPSPSLRAAPLDAVPLQNSQLPDTELDLQQHTQPLPPETLDDVPVDAIATAPNVLRATSDNRGTADEHVTLISQGESGNYLVQVSDYEGDSKSPYMLQVEVSGPPNLGACQPRSIANASGQALPAVDANTNTLILVNEMRLRHAYGVDGANSVMAKLNQLAGRSDLGIVGAVLPVDRDPGVAGAYDNWDANPCSPARANDVVREIGQLIDSVEPENLQYKVIVGGDDVIPFARVPDETTFANEITYTQSLGSQNNQYVGAFGNGFMLTDDVWAEESAPQLFGHELFVPEQAVGRVLESPGEITGMIDAFLAANGAIAPQRSLVTGYDFLSDGANAINAPFNVAFGAEARTLISETWNATDLDSALFPGSNPPQLNSINAHFDHTRSLPADESAAQRETNLYTSQDVRDRGAGALAQRVLFSIGCHAGLPISDTIYGAANPLTRDWAQTFLSGGAFAWIGNTGYGLGDTVEVAYSERLHALFSGNLDGSLTLGEALAQAKQEYLSTLGIVGGYDAKVVMEATLFGLPMLKLGSDAVPAQPPPLPTQTDPATGLAAASFNTTPNFTLVSTPNGSFYRAETTQATNRRPLEPVVSVDVTQPGKVAHGVVITSLESLADQTNFDAAFSRVVNDDSDEEPEVVGEVSHPAKIQSISTYSSFASPSVPRQKAVLIAGLFRSDGNPDPEGVGIHRLYNEIGGYVLYASPSENDFTPPSLGGLETQKIGNGIGFAVDVTDAAGTVEDVKVIYRDCSNTWRLVTLQPSGGSRFSGGGAVAPGCNQIDYYLQAVDDAGNVAVSSKKVAVEALEIPQPTGDTPITISLSGSQHESDWYTSAVTVTISPSSGMKYSVDGGAFQPYPADGFTVSGDGVHLVRAEAADGSTDSEGFAIDTSAPTVLMTTPPAGAVYEQGQVVHADYTCADSGSGPASCSGTPANGAPLDTSSVGTKEVSVTATDKVGHSTTFKRTYEVVHREILFASTRTGNGDIYAISPAGGTPAQLTTENSIDAEPEWFPGGERIVFSSSRTGSGDIYAMDDDGTNVVRLTSDPAIDTSPAVSPDGSRIAFSSRRGGNWDIYVMNADGSNVKRLTNHGQDDLLPAWSSNGSEIAFFSNRTGNGDIYKLAVPPPTSSTIPPNVRLTSSSGIDTEPAWFGSTIAFSSNRIASNNFEIFTVPSTGGTQQPRLTFQAGHDTTPAWSGDGQKLAFASNRSPGGGLNFNIWTMNKDGSGQAPLVTHGAADVFPDW